jgi:hypothetical protein
VAKRTSGLEAKILELEAELGDVSGAYETLHQTHADTLTQVRASFSPPPPRETASPPRYSGWRCALVLREVVC